MRTLHVTILLLLSIVFAGCESFREGRANIDTSYKSTLRQNFDDKVQSWVGVTGERLLEEWGYPQRTINNPLNGNRVLVYGSQRTSSTSIPIYKNGPVYTAQNTRYCNIYFELDNTGIIIKSRYEGNACR